LTDLTRHLRSFASGKGRTDILARASLVGEVAERHSAVFRGDEPRIRGTFLEYHDRAIHPNSVMLFSEHQLALRSTWATVEDPIPHKLSENEQIDWTPIWSVTENRQKLAPTSLLYFGAPENSGGSFCIADSNGNAAAASLESAMLQGLLELIERDAVGIWWFNAVQRPAVALDSIGDEWIDAFIAQLAAIRRDAWVLDVTTDNGIPAYAAISRRMDGSAEEIMFGFGAHVDAKTAVVRALTELGQTLAVMQEISKGNAPVTSGLREWLHSASLEGCPYLVPLSEIGLRDSVASADSSGDAFDICRRRLEKLGLECLVLDQTRADVGIPTVKMIVPGLRHYRRRLGPGRLYSTPRSLGWVKEAKGEEQLNSRVLSF
jgi:ribosomal protein S12 methylthiotransferase accessory factor